MRIASKHEVNYVNAGEILKICFQKQDLVRDG